MWWWKHSQSDALWRRLAWAWLAVEMVQRDLLSTKQRKAWVFEVCLIYIILLHWYTSFMWLLLQKKKLQICSFKITNFFSHNSGGSKLKSRCWQDNVPSKDFRENPFLSFPVSDGSRCSLTCGCKNSISTVIFMLPSSFCVFFSSVSYEDTLLLDLGPTCVLGITYLCRILQEFFELPEFDYWPL